MGIHPRSGRASLKPSPRKARRPLASLHCGRSPPLKNPPLTIAITQRNPMSRVSPRVHPGFDQKLHHRVPRADWEIAAETGELYSRSVLQSRVRVAPAPSTVRQARPSRDKPADEPHPTFSLRWPWGKHVRRRISPSLSPGGCAAVTYSSARRGSTTRGASLATGDRT
jgi:hypothetical protein